MKCEDLIQNYTIIETKGNRVAIIYFRIDFDPLCTGLVSFKKSLIAWHVNQKVASVWWQAKEDFQSDVCSRIWNSSKTDMRVWTLNPPFRNNNPSSLYPRSHIKEFTCYMSPKFLFRWTRILAMGASYSNWALDSRRDRMKLKSLGRQM